MRKTSQDGGDSTSITSGVENEIKKPCAAVIKNKRNSIKRKVQTLSHESDDAVIEPLLQKEKEKPETLNQSAKFSILKSKTDAQSKDSDKDKLLPDNNAKTSGLPEVSLAPSTKENIFKSQPITTAPLHNHMNTNVFSSIDTTKFSTTTKNQILVEIDGCKQGGFNPSPLIFTTAKIHTDNKTKQMEPVQVTAVPILSTTEIANAGKLKNVAGITQAIPGTSVTKANESFSVANTTVTAGKDSKYNIPKTTSETKIQNTLADRAVNNLLLKDSTKPNYCKKDIPKQQEGKIDENANASTAAVPQLVSPSVADIKKLPVDPKQHTDSGSKDKPSKDKASLSGIKQLPRQKNAIVEDTADSILKPKPSGSESLRYSNITQYSKDIDSVPTKVLRGPNDVSNKTLPKTSANNILDSTNTKITATSIASKSTSSFTSTVKPTVAASPQCSVTTGTMSTTTKPTFTKITSTDTKSAAIPTSSFTTISSKPQTTSSTQSSVIPSAGYNKVLTSSTIKPADTAVVIPSIASSKTSGASVKTTTGDVTLVPTQNVLTTTANGSNLTSISVKPSITKTVNTSSTSSTSAAKPVTTTPVAKSSASNKKNGPKTNEVNKDSKGLKA
ncbi:mucin-5AC-like [Manduca sexta]|uniref:mucin-5AC-like n=1 Tax=Manduca sexta TaxID=7130 RepID=UPI00188E0C49|nr:mucin-5AC-like [Manduca sexta]